MSIDAWQLWIAVVALAINGGGLGIVALQVALARRQAREAQVAQAEERLRLKKQSTLEFATGTLETRNRFRSRLPDDFDKAGIKQLVEKCLAGEDPESLNLVTQYLGYFETFAVSISLGVHDLETADSLFGSRVIAVNKHYAPLVQYWRELVGRDSLFRELEWLADALQDFRASGAGYAAQGSYVPLALRSGERSL